MLSDLHLEDCLCIYFIFILFRVHLLRRVRVGSFNSPLTMAVTWSLPVPMRFLTSQTKVVLTASSTFSTFSSFCVICTVSGISPDILQGHEHISMRNKKSVWLSAQGEHWDRCTFTETCCIVQCHQIPLILIGSAKPISFPLPQKPIH